MKVRPWCGAIKRWNCTWNRCPWARKWFSQLVTHKKTLENMTHNRCEAFSVMDHAAGGEMLWSPYELDNVFPAESFRQVSIETEALLLDMLWFPLYHSRPALLNGTNHKAHIKSCSSPLSQTRADDPQDRSFLVLRCERLRLATMAALIHILMTSQTEILDFANML